ncbi:MAG: hypothetical protein QJR04_25260 [Burkholderia multivorans]|nr:hypothetical protein [Burkholderia multivorans]
MLLNANFDAIDSAIYDAAQAAAAAQTSADNAQSSANAAQSTANNALGIAQAALPLSGGTLTGPLTLKADPSNPLGASTKQYVDNTAATLMPKTGGTFTGGVSAPSFTATGGALYAQGYSSNPAAGVVYLGNTGSRYLYYDGSAYNLPGAGLNVNGHAAVLNDGGTYSINISGQATGQPPALLAANAVGAYSIVLDYENYCNRQPTYNTGGTYSVSGLPGSWRCMGIAVTSQWLGCMGCTFYSWHALMLRIA